MVSQGRHAAGERHLVLDVLGGGDRGCVMRRVGGRAGVVCAVGIFRNGDEGVVGQRWAACHQNLCLSLQGQTPDCQVAL